MLEATNAAAPADRPSADLGDWPGAAQDERKERSGGVLADPGRRVGALPAATAGRSRGTLALLAASAGLGAANLYYAQPLAAAIARDFHTTASGVSSALVGMPLGYAAGMLLLVPLGDAHEHRGVIVTTALSAACALLGFAAAPSLALLAAASAAVGLCASLTQMMVPFAVGLAPPEDRGRVVGAVMSGLLAGVLLSRTASGTLATVIGWRGVFVAAAGVMIVLAAVLRVALPPVVPSERLSYRARLGVAGGDRPARAGAAAALRSRRLPLVSHWLTPDR